MVGVDHPDIERYIRRNVVEEAQVAAVVAGSHMPDRHLNAALAATEEGDDEPTAALGQ